MRISEHWLREWINPDVDTVGLAEQLTMAGLEVDGVEPCAPALDNVVVGTVLEKVPHPDADRLSVCSVDAGADEPLQIVCGASNVAVGGFYPVATLGAVLPGDFKIKRSKLRGVESFGMLCSGVELGIAAEADGLLELDGKAPAGTAIVAALGLDDQIIDLDLTPNRADCFSVIGVARDIAAVNELEFSEPVIAPVAAAHDDRIVLELAAGEACPAFASRIIRAIDPTAATPVWMMEKLRRAGIRPLQPVVDITNYVMLEFGQPMHAYDLARLNGAVTVRLAAKKEKLTLLDGQEAELDSDVLVIADDKGPIGLAGVMGGSATAVGDSTNDILLESAFFSPAAMAGRARRFGLHTEASLRFERGVDYLGQTRAIERATALILYICGGAPGPVHEVRDESKQPARSAVVLRRAKLDRVLGISIPTERVTAMFKRLGMQVEFADDVWSVLPLSARFDIAIEEDLIEEVVRLYGYDQVPEVAQVFAPALAAATESRVALERARTLLVDRGYQEAITYSFVDPDTQQALLGEADELQLTNPLSREQSVMRRTLWVGLLEAANANRKRQQNSVRLYESGVSFTKQANEINEEELLAGLAWGKLRAEHWDEATRRADLFDIKQDLQALLALNGDADRLNFVAAEHRALRPGRTARIERDGVAVGWLGELHPRVAKSWGMQAAPVLFELNVAAALAAEVPSYEPISRFPSVRRDIAVMVAENIPVGEVLAVAREAAGRLLQHIRVFDVYRGDSIEKGLKSVALGLILQETSRTLTDLEIDEVVDTIKVQLSSKFNASIRE